MLHTHHVPRFYHTTTDQEYLHKEVHLQTSIYIPFYSVQLHGAPNRDVNMLAKFMKKSLTSWTHKYSLWSDDCMNNYRMWPKTIFILLTSRHKLFFLADKKDSIQVKDNIQPSKRTIECLLLDCCYSFE